MGSIAFCTNNEEAAGGQLSQTARVFIMITRLHRLIDLASQTLKLFLIYSHTGLELDKQRVKRTPIIRPLRGHHPECSLQMMPRKRVLDGSAHKGFVQLLTAHIHHLRLPPHKSDERTL